RRAGAIAGAIACPELAGGMREVHRVALDLRRNGSHAWWHAVRWSGHASASRVDVSTREADDKVKA
ncbi:MAG: hypothetical protein K8W52_29185, partial [Deltaproteobacteria bacterium]|nr:hypothetical protein [Deltaproteobacteria bacterium]